MRTVRVREPCWTKPALVAPGAALRVVIDGQTADDVAVCLRRRSRTVPLHLADRADSPDARRTALTCALPDEAPAGLCDLLLRAGGRHVEAPSSVWARPALKDPFTFLHTSDLHLLIAGPRGETHDRSSVAERLVEAVNARRPEFVIDTGDLVARYASDPSRALGPECVRWQVRRIRRILLRLEVPLFFTPGNHDVAFSWSRAAWRDHAGAPWGEETVDYSFDYGPYHFAALDASVTYDDVTLAPRRMHFLPRQLAWLADDMRRARPSRLRLLLSHYDYRRQLAALLEPLRIDALFYGHSVRIPYAEPPRPFLNGHLPADRAFQSITVSDGRLSVAPGPRYDELGARPRGLPGPA